MKQIKSHNFRQQSVWCLLLVITLVVAGIAPIKASAATALGARKLVIGTSKGNTATTWNFTLNESVATTLKGMTFQVCDAPSGTCNIPGSWVNTGSTLTSLTYNSSAQTGWTIDNTSGMLRIKNDTASTTVTNPIVVSFSNVTNPNTTNATFYVRMATYSGAAYTTQVDSGVVAASTSEQILLNGTMDESLVFCTGITITGTDCSTASGNAVNFGTFSSTAPSSGTSIMAASTNASTGYSITVNGSTLTCGACAGTPSITALAAQAASATGTAQFGTNLKQNTTPAVGANVSGSGIGSATANYGTANQFRFVSGDSVALSSSATNANTYTVSYLVNVPGNQQPGLYTATMDYICTATY